MSAASQAQNDCVGLHSLVGMLLVGLLLACGELDGGEPPSCQEHDASRRRTTPKQLNPVLERDLTGDCTKSVVKSQQQPTELGLSMHP